jgi:hypothetical protein
MMPGFQDPISGSLGNLLINALKSPNFSLDPPTGWAVLKNGDAYFFNVTASGDIVATQVIAEGPGAGMFVYYGAPGPGTLVVAIAAESGEDAYGNPYSAPGISLSAPGSGSKNNIQLRPDKGAILVYQ